MASISFNPDALSEAFEFNEDVREIFNSIIQPLQDLYKIYLPWETAPAHPNKAKAEQSNRAFIRFLKDFEIFPSLVTITTITRLWNDIILNQGEFPPAQSLLPNPTYEKGSVLTFSKFLFFLYVCGILGYSQDSQLSDCSAAEKLLILLERMEIAKEKIPKQTHRPRTARDSLLPPRRVLDKMLKYEAVEEESVDNHQSQTDLNFDSNGLEMLEKYVDNLLKIFQSYCSYGEPMNTTRLKSSMLIKMLKDCGLLKEQRGAQSFDISTESISASPNLSKVEVDLLFSKLTGSSANSIHSVSRGNFAPSSHLSLQNSKSYGRMEFQQFLKFLEIISRKVYSDLDPNSACANLIENNILQIESSTSPDRSVNSQYVERLMEMLENEDVIEALSLVHEAVIPYYFHYCDSQGYMNFSAFARFAKDFQIFPDLTTKAKLMRYFYTLAGIFAQSQENNQDSSVSSQKAPDQTEAEIIDQHLFVEALALIAADVQYSISSLTPVHRICYFIERLNQSQGHDIVGRTSKKPLQRVDMVGGLKAKYPQVFAHRRPSTHHDLVS